MANVYSTLLVSAKNLGQGTPFLPPIVPAGFVWVIRSISAANMSARSTFVGGIIITDSFDNNEIWGTPLDTSISSKVYTAELRQVVPSGRELLARTFSPGWDVRISGFQLTLP